MAYFYCKSGESAGSGGTTIQSGDFTTVPSTNTFPSIQSAIDTGGATSGDYICVSDASTFTSASYITYAGPASGDFLYIVSVDDANVENEKAAVAAQEEETGAGNAILITGRVSMFGLYLKSINDIQANAVATQTVAKDCTLEVTGASDVVWRQYVDGAYSTFINCGFIGVAGAVTRISSGGFFRAFGCTVTGLTDLWNSSMGGNGGAHIEMAGCDLSSVTGSLWEDGGASASADDVINIKYVGCKLNASTPTFVTETLENLSHRLEMSNCGSTSGQAEYQFYTEAYGGSVEEDTVIYRAESTAYESGEQISLKCNTNADATRATPFWFDLPTRFVELSNAASDVIRIYLASNFTTAPTDNDIWAEAVYPDGTTKHEYNFITSRNANVLATTGTTLTTDSGSDWRDGAGALSGYDEQYIELDIGSFDPGSDGVPIIRIYNAKYEAAKDIHYCVTLGLS